MNKAYRLIWNSTKEIWMVAAESVSNCTSFCSPLVAAAVITAAVFCSAGQAQALDPVALPTNGQIIAGSGTIAKSGSTLTVNQGSGRLVTNWDTFNIGQNANVQFIQPGSASVALNRIADQNPTQIMGGLTANGQVFLLNPAGIVFGPTARVDVGGLVASSLGLATDDFMAGRSLFSKDGTAGAIINQGSIRTANGGYVAFVGPRVQNNGTITANGGSVVLAAGDKVSLDFAGDGLVNYTVDQGAVDAQAANSGLIKADGGMVVLTAKAAAGLTSAVVNNTGLVVANTLTEKGGRIILEAVDGTTTTSGTLQAVGDDTGEQGGSIKVLGSKVGILAGSQLDASGDSGGGSVLVGGNWHGAGSEANSTKTFVAGSATIDASALNNGNGGEVVVWSDQTTVFHGAITAKGGLLSGDGGKIEVSGKGTLVFDGTADTTAVHGKVGSLLLDPVDVIIANNDPGGALEGVAIDEFDDLNDNPGSNTWIQPSTLVTLLDTNNVSVKAGNDIVVTDSIDASFNAGIHDLQFEAGRSLLVNNNIFLRGSFTAITNMLPAGSLGRNAGAGGITMAPGKTIAANNGYIALINQNADTTTGVTIANLYANSSISISSDSMELAGAPNSIATNDAVFLTSRTPGRPIILGGADDGAALSLSNNEIGTIDPSASNIFIGNSDGTGLLTVAGPLDFQTNARLYNSGVGGSIHLGAAAVVNVAADKSLEFIAGTGDTALFSANPAAVVNAGNGRLLNITADTISVAGANFNGNNAWLYIMQSTNGRPLALGNSVAGGTLIISNTELASFTGFAVMQLGDSANSSTATLTGPVNFSTPTNVFAGPGGTIHLDSSAAITAHEIGFRTGADGTFTQDAGATISNVDNVIFIVADNLNLNGNSNSITSTGIISIAPSTSTRPIVVGGPGVVGDMAITQNALASLTPGYNELWVGDYNHTGPTTFVAPVVLPGTLMVREDQTGQINFNAPVTVTAGQIMILDFAPVSLADSITAADGVAIKGDITVAADDKVISAGTGMADLIGDIDHGSNNFTIEADSQNITGSWTGTGSRTIQPFTQDRAIAVGFNGGAGSLNLGAAMLANLDSGTPSSITIGRFGGTGAVEIDNVSFTNNLTLEGGSITQSGPLNVGGNLALKANLGIGIQLEDGLNSFGGEVSINSADRASLTASGGLVLAASAVNGDLTLNLGGNLTQTAPINVAGATTITAPGSDVLLDDISNYFEGPVSVVTANSLDLRGDDLNLGVINVDDTIYLESANSIIQTAPMIANGGFEAVAAGDIILDNPANEFYGPVLLEGSDVTITSDVPLLFDGITAVNASIIAGGDITQQGPFQIDDTLTLDANYDGSISLDDTNNEFGGPISIVKAQDVVLNAASGVDLGTSVVHGDFSVAVDGAVSQSGPLRVDGAAQIESYNDEIRLDNPANVFNDTLTAVAANNITIASSTSLTLGAITSDSGTIDVSTVDGGIWLTDEVYSSDATADAIKIAAATGTSFGNPNGGEVVIDGGYITLDSPDGQANLYSGSYSGSTSVSDLIDSTYGPGSGRFRYNSDPTQANFSAALTTGINLIYREQPVLIVTPDAATIVYGSAIPAMSTTITGYLNGDQDTISMGGAEQILVLGTTDSGSGKVKTGAYDAFYNGGLDNDLGYAISDNSSSINELVVSKKDVGVSSLVATDRAYNGTTTVALTGVATVNGLLAGDDLNLGGAPTGTLVGGKDIGVHGVTVTGSTLTGDDSANYNLLQQTGLSATIAKADVTVAGLSATSRSYNGTAVAALTGTATITKFGTDDVAVDGTVVGVFDEKNFGSGKTVTVTGNDLTGTDAANYNIIQQTGLTADISKADVSVSGLSATNRVYDATTAVALTGTAAITKFLSDDVTVANSISGILGNKNAGTSRAVTTVATLAGADAANYNLLQQGGLTVDIAKADVTVSGLTAASRSFNGTDVATLTGTAAITKFGTDEVTLANTGAGTFNNKNVGTAKAVTTAVTLAGADAGNYNLLQPIGLTADIAKASLVITADSASKTDGTERIFVGTEFIATGIQTGDTVTAATLTSSGAPATAPVGNYAIVVSDASGTFTPGNYDTTYVAGNLEVAPVVSQSTNSAVDTAITAALASISPAQHRANGTSHEDSASGQTATGTPFLGAGAGSRSLALMLDDKLIVDRTGYRMK